MAKHLSVLGSLSKYVLATPRCPLLYRSNDVSNSSLSGRNGPLVQDGVPTVPRPLVRKGTTGIGIGTGTGTEIMTVTETAVVVIQIGTGVTETAQDRPGGILTATIGTETGRATGVAIGDVLDPQGVKRGKMNRRRKREMWIWRTERGGEVLRRPHRQALSRGSRLDVTMDVGREIGGLVESMRMAIPGRTGTNLPARSLKRTILYKNSSLECLMVAFLCCSPTIGPRRYDTLFLEIEQTTCCPICHSSVSNRISFVVYYMYLL
jgi:hypothetical protein